MVNNEDFFKHLAAGNEAADVRLTSDYEKAQQILADLHDGQRGVIEDPFRFKSVCTPRRAGKTFTVGAAAFYTALMRPKAVVCIITLTLKSAKRLYWNDIILEFSDRYDLNLRRKGGVHHTSLEATLENGSRIFLVGAETRAEIEKLRGGEYDLAAIDECKSFSQPVLDELIDEILVPAVNSRTGSLLLVGTPGSYLAGPFYEATHPGFRDNDGHPVSSTYGEPEQFWADNPQYLPLWSRHNWDVSANTAKPDLWKLALERKAQKKWLDDNPIWLREYLGQWVATGDVMVYQFVALRSEDPPGACRCSWTPRMTADNNVFGLPMDEDWRYVLGLDLGFEDDTAIVVLAYSPTHQVLYQVYEFKTPHLLVGQLATQLKAVIDLIPGEVEAMVADTGNLAKTVIATLNGEHGFWFEAAEKREKFDYIELLNGDLVDGRFKIMEDSELAHEWSLLQWLVGDKDKTSLARGGRLKENPQCPNHLSDATLYAWRYCLHHFSRTPTPTVAPESQQAYDIKDYKDAVLAATRRDKPEALHEWTDPLEEEDPWTNWIW